MFKTSFLVTSVKQIRLEYITIMLLNTVTMVLAIKYTKLRSETRKLTNQPTQRLDDLVLRNSTRVYAEGFEGQIFPIASFSDLTSKEIYVSYEFSQLNPAAAGSF